jgi:hypothetical protein
MKCYAAEQQAGSASGNPCIGKRYKTSLCALSESEATYTGAVLDPLLFLPVVEDDGRCCKRCSQCVCFWTRRVALWWVGLRALPSFAPRFARSRVQDSGTAWCELCPICGGEVILHPPTGLWREHQRLYSIPWTASQAITLPLLA